MYAHAWVVRGKISVARPVEFLAVLLAILVLWGLGAHRQRFCGALSELYHTFCFEFDGLDMLVKMGEKSPSGY